MFVCVVKERGTGSVAKRTESERGAVFFIFSTRRALSDSPYTPPSARRRLPSSLRPAPRTATVAHAQWLDNSAEISVAAPLEACWEMWEARERIPSWMPWIASVEVRAG